MRKSLLIAAAVATAIVALSIAAGNLVMQVGVQFAWRIGG